MSDYASFRVQCRTLATSPTFAATTCSPYNDAPSPPPTGTTAAWTKPQRSELR